MTSNGCIRPECHQTSAGCGHRGPLGEMCWFGGDDRPPLSLYSDEELSRELHHRMMCKLGDPRVGVSMPMIAVWPHNLA